MVKGMHRAVGIFKGFAGSSVDGRSRGIGREGSSALAAVIQHPTGQPLGHYPSQKWRDLNAGKVHAKPAAGSMLSKPLLGINSPPFSLPGPNTAFNLTHGQLHMHTSLSQHKLTASMLGEEDVQHFGL